MFFFFEDRAPFEISLRVISASFGNNDMKPSISYEYNIETVKHCALKI